MKIFRLLFLSPGLLWAFAANPVLDTLSDNTAVDLGAYTCNQPVGSAYYCEAITDYSGFTYDAARHQLLMFGGGHSSTFRDDVDVFNLSTLKWAPAYNSTPCAEMIDANLDKAKGAWISTNHPFSRHSYDLLLTAGNTKELLLLCPGGFGSSICENASYNYPLGKAAHYNPDTKTWAYGASMSGVWDYCASAEFDPVSGLVIVLQEAGLWTYDPATQTIAKRLSYPASNMGYCNHMVYFPPNDRFYYIVQGNPTRLFEVTLNRQNWGASTVLPVQGVAGVPGTDEAGWAYDTVNQIIGGGVKNGVFYAYDPFSKAWTAKTIQEKSPNAVGSVAFHALSYDPVNNAFIFLTQARRTWGYRYKKAAGTEAETPREERWSGFRVSPSPARPGAAITVGSGKDGARIGGNLALYDLAGRRVADLFQGQRGGFSLPPLSPSIYLLKLQAGDKIHAAKLLVQN